MVELKYVLPNEPNYTLQELVRRMTGEKTPRVGAHHQLRSQVTLTFALLKSELPQASFAEEHVYRHRTNSRLLAKWLNGQSRLSRISAAALNKRLPGTLDTFDLPLYELIANAPLSEQKIATLLEPYRTKADHPLHGKSPWLFPDFSAKLKDKTCVLIMGLADTENLKQYGTIESFCVILGIMRAAEARNDLSTHLRAAQDLFRALPMVLKLPWFAPHAKALTRQLLRIRNRVPNSYFYFDVNWRLILRQARDPDYHPFRYRWPRDPQTRRFIEPEDPILPAEVIGGWEWHVKELRRRAASLRRRASRSASRRKPEA